MNDREFISNLIKVYFSNAKEPHQATLDNTITNRLNDIANKLENQEKENAEYKEVLDIIWKKPARIEFAIVYIKMTINPTYEDYCLIVIEEFRLPEEEFDLLNHCFEKNIQKQ